MKYVVFLGDGMADRAIPSLHNETPLEAAVHPAMDYLASHGLYGLTQTIPAGMKPGSDPANLAVFGYDPKVYYSGRSPLEAVSMGVPMTDKDVSYRCNLVTLSGGNTLEACVMADYSAGEISSQEARPLIEEMNRRCSREEMRLYPGFSYRHCLVLSGAKTGAVLTPPHDISGQSIADRMPAGENAPILNQMIRTSFQCLRDHPVNQARIRSGKNPANAVWFWGEGTKPALSSFRDRFGLKGAVISAVDLIQGIGICAGLDVIKVEGATGNWHTNFRGKGEAAVEALRGGYDFVYIHVEAPDECGHHGEIKEKVWSIEQIDRQILQPVLAALDDSGQDYACLLMPDHPTPIEIRTHTADPVPFALYRRGNSQKCNLRYNEREALKTSLFVAKAHEILPFMTGKRPLLP